MEYFLTTFLDPTYLTVERFAVSVGEQSFWIISQKISTKKKKFFAYVFALIMEKEKNL